MEVFMVHGTLEKILSRGHAYLPEKLTTWSRRA